MRGRSVPSIRAHVLCSGKERGGWSHIAVWVTLVKLGRTKQYKRTQNKEKASIHFWDPISAKKKKKKN